MLRIFSSLVGIVRLAALAFDDVHVVERDPHLDQPLREAAARIAARTEVSPLTGLVRAMYRRVGIDPTKTRPSSEALLRRIRRGEPLPRVNTLVDVGNWCSAEWQLPYGLYDLDRVQSPIELRRGRANESYEGIRKDAVRLEGRMVLADTEGPFGNPTSDSARTMITARTTRALVVIFAPWECDVERLAGVSDATADRIRTFAAGVERMRIIEPVAGDDASADRTAR